jgi:PAS domain S-box-containing protein
MSQSGVPLQEGELLRLRRQIDDLSSALHAIRSGDVDVLVRDDSGSVQLYSRTSADRPYRLIVEEMGEGAATLSPAGRILFANQRLAQLLGRERSALIGLPLSDLVAADGLEGLNALLAVIPGQTLRQPLELRRADGVGVPVLASMSALAIEGEAVRCLIAADLAPIREAERALTASELNFRMLVLNSQDGILNLAWQSGVITLVNPCLCRLLGREEADLIGRRIWEIGAFQGPPPAQELFERMKASASVHLDDITLQTATGERRQVEFFSNV